MKRRRAPIDSYSYYKRYRRNLLGRILVRNGEKLPDAELLFCENCYKRQEACEELHIHHPNENGDVSGAGGWQAFYAHREDFEEGVELRVWCKSCHLAHHNKKTFAEVQVDV